MHANPLALDCEAGVIAFSCRVERLDAYIMFIHVPPTPAQEQALASVAVGRLVRRHSSLRSNNKRTTNEDASNVTSPRQSVNRKPRMRHSSESELDMHTVGHRDSQWNGALKGSSGQNPMDGIAEHQLEQELHHMDGWHMFLAVPNQVPNSSVTGASPLRPSTLNAAA